MSRSVTRAFTLIEILVVVGLLSIIVFGLLAMFNQTQRALRTGLTQTDVLAGGRLATDMIAREIEQVTPIRAPGVNFYAEIPGTLYAPVAYQPLRQQLPGFNPTTKQPDQRTNVIEYLYFLTHENQTWSGIGYLVDPPDQGIGTLYRFVNPSGTNQNPAALFFNGFNGFQDFIAHPPIPVTNTAYAAYFHRILDGVVHFRVRAFDTNSDWITDNIGSPNNGTNILVRDWPVGAPTEAGSYLFTSNAVPAFVELEIGVLEDRAYQRFQSLPTVPPSLRLNYLSNHVGQVHLFRQRIPVRNLDPSAYQ